MKLAALIAALILSGLRFRAAAESSDGLRDSSIVLAELESKPVAVSLVRPADFVSVPVRVTSELRNTAAAYDETRQTIDLITRKAKESGQFRAKVGVISLSHYQGSSVFSSGSWGPAASAEVFILAPLSTNKANIFRAGAAAAQFVESLTLPGKAKCELGRLQLAVENPEQYREKVLEMIRQDIKRTRDTLAPQGGFKLDGLESPVVVRQVDDRNVALFLNYSLSVSETR